MDILPPFWSVSFLMLKTGKSLKWVYTPIVCGDIGWSFNAVRGLNSKIHK